MSPTFSPISLGGVGRATVTSTSGSPTVNNNSRAGKTVYEFNGSGSITIGSAGYAEIAVIGGGGGSLGNHEPGGNTEIGGGGGGGGGVHQDLNYFFNAESHTITVGAGASAGGVIANASGSGPRTMSGYPGSASRIGNTRVPGGGPSLWHDGSGNVYTGVALSNQYWLVVTGGSTKTTPYSIGNNVFLGCGSLGGSAGHHWRGAGGGGGGSGGGGGDNSSQNVTGNGGSGTTLNITGSAVTFGGGGAGGARGNNNGTGGAGGGGDSTVSGAANTGGGAGGGGNPAPASGGSGKVIVVIG
jgi:hypothetical protein